MRNSYVHFSHLPHSPFTDDFASINQALRQEISFASYLSITTIIIPPPRLENREYLADYARAINGTLASSWHINVSHARPDVFREADLDLATIDLDPLTRR